MGVTSLNDIHISKNDVIVVDEMIADFDLMISPENLATRMPGNAYKL